MALTIIDNTDIEINISGKELEVWEIIKTNLKNILSGNTDKYIDSLHEKFTGWSNDEFLPVQKPSILSELKSLKTEGKEISFRLFPLSIKVEDNTAVVHYVFSATTVDENKNKIEKRAKLTDVLIKQRGKWFLLGDHVGK